MEEKFCSKEHNPDVNEARYTSRYLGGLTPNYPIDRIFIYNSGCSENDLQNEGMIAGCYKYIILKDNELKIINNKEDLKSKFAPIDNYEEALSLRWTMRATL